MLASIMRTRVVTPIRDLPQTLRVRCTGPIPPTHIFAIPGANSITRFICLHNAVFATHCSKLPLFPASRTVLDADGCYSIPVIPLRIPFPNVWPIIHEYLYMKSASDLAYRLSLPEYAAHENHLILRTGNILAIAADADYLGIHDEVFWEVLDREWAAVREQLLTVPPPVPPPAPPPA